MLGVIVVLQAEVLQRTASAIRQPQILTQHPGSQRHVYCSSPSTTASTYCRTRQTDPHASSGSCRVLPQCRRAASVQYTRYTLHAGMPQAPTMTLAARSRVVQTARQRRSPRHASATICRQSTLSATTMKRHGGAAERFTQKRRRYG